MATVLSGQDESGLLTASPESAGLRGESVTVASYVALRAWLMRAFPLRADAGPLAEPLTFRLARQS